MICCGKVSSLNQTRRTRKQTVRRSQVAPRKGRPRIKMRAVVLQVKRFSWSWLAFQVRSKQLGQVVALAVALAGCSRQWQRRLVLVEERVREMQVRLEEWPGRARR